MVDRKALEDNVVLLLPEVIGSSQNLMPAALYLMNVRCMPLKFHFMQEKNFAIIALERVFMQVISVKMLCHTASIIKHPTMGLIRQFLISKALETCPWLQNICEMLLCCMEELIAWTERDLCVFVGAVSNVGRAIEVRLRVC